jgi:transcriptional regulator with XRE-family HTH domain
MLEISNIGSKIRFFRERANLSQFELEQKIDASPGSLSRIENNITNPTKETIDKLVKALNLNFNEIVYLNENNFGHVTLAEINNAKEEIDSVLKSTKLIAYLMDGQLRVWEISKGLQLLLKLSDTEKNKLLGINLMEFICDPNLPAYKFIQGEGYMKMFEAQLARLLYERPYLYADHYWAGILKKLSKFDHFNIAFEKAKNNKLDVFSEESRTVGFDFWGFKIRLTYAKEDLKDNPKFNVIIYYPTNKLLRLLSGYEK